MKTLSIDTDANHVPETLWECLNTECCECIMCIHTITVAGCKHKGLLTIHAAREQYNDHTSSEVFVDTPRVDIRQTDEFYPETLAECADTPCSQCIVYAGTPPIECKHRILLQKTEPSTENTCASNETDPTGRTSTDPGAKMDEGKVLAGTLVDFGLALTEVAKVSTHGINKYSRGGWRSVPDGELRYTDAMWRHLLTEGHEIVDTDSGLRHAAHLAWNALARLELRMESEQ